MTSNFAISEYRKEDYQEIYRLSEDRDNMDDNWEDWKANKKKAIKNFKKMGLNPIDIIVKPKELVVFCRENGLSINGNSRSQFVSYKAMKLNEK